MNDTREKSIYRIFELALLLKIFNSIWEITLGIFILLDKKLTEKILSAVQYFSSDDSPSFVTSHIEHFLSNITRGTEIFISIYFLAQGVLKILLIVGLWKKKLWTYPVSIGVFFIFTFYQLYRYIHSFAHPPFLIFLSVFDVLTILLIQHEYKQLKKSVM